MKTTFISGLDRNYRRNFLTGLAASLFLVWMAFEWTTPEPPDYASANEDGLFSLVEEIEVVRTMHPRIPAAPIPKVLNAPSSVIEPIVEPFYGFEPSLTDTASFSDPGELTFDVRGAVTTVSPPPRPVIPKTEAPLVIAEIMPRFPGCEDRPLSKDERKACSDKALLEFIYGRLEYPQAALENGITGTVVVRFVVEKDGSVTDAQIARDIGGGCGKAVLKVVEGMPEWIPGSQQGRKVRVQLFLPVRFEAKRF